MLKNQQQMAMKGLYVCVYVHTHTYLYIYIHTHMYITLKCPVDPLDARLDLRKFLHTVFSCRTVGLRNKEVYVGLVKPGLQLICEELPK